MSRFHDLLNEFLATIHVGDGEETPGHLYYNAEDLEEYVTGLEKQVAVAAQYDREIVERCIRGLRECFAQYFDGIADRVGNEAADALHREFGLEPKP